MRDRWRGLKSNGKRDWIPVNERKKKKIIEKKKNKTDS
jgi:hypothetical protein